MKRLKKKKDICYEKLHLRKSFIKFSRKRQDTLGGFFMKIEKLLFMLMKVKRKTTLYPPFPEILLLYLIYFLVFLKRYVIKSLIVNVPLKKVEST